MRIRQVISETVSKLKFAADKITDLHKKHGPVTLQAPVDPKFKPIVSMILTGAIGLQESPYHLIETEIAYYARSSYRMSGREDMVSLTFSHQFFAFNASIDIFLENLPDLITRLMNKLSSKWQKTDARNDKIIPYAYSGRLNDYCVYENSGIQGWQNQNILHQLGMLTGIIQPEDERLAVGTYNLCPGNDVYLVGDEQLILKLINAVKSELSIVSNLPVSNPLRFFVPQAYDKPSQVPNYLVASQGEPVTLQGRDQPSRHFIELMDGNYLTNDKDGTLRIWDAITGAKLHEIKARYDNNPEDCIGELPNGKIIIGSDSSLGIWDRDTQRYSARLHGAFDYGSYKFTNISTMNNLVAAGSNKAVLAVWNFESGERMQQLELTPISDKNRIFCQALMPDNTLVAGCSDCTMRVWNPYTGECLGALHDNSGSVIKLAVLSSKEVVGYAKLGTPCTMFTSKGVEETITGSGDGTLIIWNLLSGAVSKIPYGYIEQLERLSNNLVMITSNSHVRVWDCRTQQHVFEIEKPYDSLVTILKNGSIAMMANHHSNQVRTIAFESLENVIDNPSRSLVRKPH